MRFMLNEAPVRTNFLRPAVQHITQLHDSSVPTNPEQSPVHLLHYASQLEQRDGFDQVAMDVAHCSSPKSA